MYWQSEGAYDQIEKEARRVAQGLGAEYWAVSSKTGDNVEALFLRVAALTFDRSVTLELSGGGPDGRKQSTVSEYLCQGGRNGLIALPLCMYSKSLY